MERGIQDKTFTLNTGAKIPAIGFGTWKAGPGEAAAAVQAAFEAGYRHFLIIHVDGNEAEIGQVFKSIEIPRNEYFVTTKLWSSDHRRITSALQKSIDDLCLDYVDLYLMHWPVTLPASTPETYGKEDRTAHDPDWDFNDTWREMEKLLSTGKVRAIGLANFSTVNLQKLLLSCKVTPAVNQTEIQPLLPQKKLNTFCVEHNIHQTAFGPLGGSGSTLHEDPLVKRIADKRGCSSGNVLLSWGVKKGWSVIPKSTNSARIVSNLQSCFSMDEEETSQIDGLAQTLGEKRFNRPNWGTVIFHDDEVENAQ
ncbi:hypothetical protein N7466_001264 [Penicillium verhagenii]|uniref:uncharacterized protein n=1 Tax=Penicillium verhagenii TaxID=1562060 RepID=UPI0025457412|nr:uncharacterized protein N7466_001264 [Penicillium verhagenii]KAJ5948249.1 hypothetical protein N7466_001264 [Penicillium verhagenii]